MSDYPSLKLQVDEEGYWLSGGVRVNDADYGIELFQNLSRDDVGRFTTRDGDKLVAVEAFDQPLVVRLLERQNEKLIGHFAYSWKQELDLASFCFDQWDRFMGRLPNGVPYSLSRAAQAALFDLMDEFDDESLTFNGKRIQPAPWLEAFSESEGAKFWSDLYQTAEAPPWDLGRETPILPAILPQLRLSRQRIAVLGCGAGHDAAFLARQGHLVTAIDYSENALIEARKKYGDVKDLKFIQADAFALPSHLSGQFDVVFEHTCYCAINPERRDELVRAWTKLLTERGHLLGIFFVMDKRRGPPWGGSEWEIRERLKKGFDFRYWTRWASPLERRQGVELVVWAQKKT